MVFIYYIMAGASYIKINLLFTHFIYTKKKSKEIAIKKK